MGATIKDHKNFKTKGNFMKQRNGKARKIPRRGQNGQPPSLLSQPIMRPRPPFPPGRLPPPNMRHMGPMPPGMRPPPRGGPFPPPHRMMGPRGPPMGMRPPMPGMRPPPGMRHPPPHMRPPMPPPHMMGPPIGPPLPMMGPGMRPPRNFHPGPPPRGMPGPANKFRRVQKGKIIKKKRPEIDLSKPWVTEMVKAEFTKKDELFKQAKSSSKQEDWTAFKQQQEKCGKVYAAAKLEYIGQHPEEASQTSSEEELEETDVWEASDSTKKSCTTCERNFSTVFQYQKHMAEHRVCGIEGCEFTAHGKIVEHHIEMQHASGLYNKIRRLQTPEDIVKWRAERKGKFPLPLLNENKDRPKWTVERTGKFPTKERIRLLGEKQEEMAKRGERIQKKTGRFARDNNTRWTKNQRPQSRDSQKRKAGPKKNTRSVPHVSLIDEKCDWNGNMFPFRGTKDLYKEVETSSDFDDSEWTATENSVKKIELKNALGALMCAYDSSNDSDAEENVPKLKPVIEDRKVDVGDDEPPVEVKIEKRVESNVEEEKKTIVENKSSKRTRNKRRFNSKAKDQTTNKRARSDFPESRFKKRRVTLLENLLEEDIRHERNVLLQCVRFVVRNNFFKNTEVSRNNSVVM